MSSGDTEAALSFPILYIIHLFYLALPELQPLKQTSSRKHISLVL